VEYFILNNSYICTDINHTFFIHKPAWTRCFKPWKWLTANGISGGSFVVEFQKSYELHASILVLNDKGITENT